jgi:hypothetical protein
MATNRLAQILEQEYKTKGILDGTVSALGKRTKEKMDIRNALFSGGGLGSTIGTKIFGKGYSATRRTPSSASATSPSLDGASNVLLEKINKNSKIAAKNSVVFPAMARDMNLMRMNMQKMVRLSGGTPSTKSDMFFKRAGDREKQYEQQYGKASSSSSSGGGGLLSGLGSIGGSLLGGLGSIGGGLLSIGGSILSGIGSLIGGVAGGIFSIISGALGGLGPLGIILGAAAGFMIYSIAKSIDFEKMGVDFKKIYTDVSTSIKSFFGIESDGKGGLLTVFAKKLDETFKTTMFSSTLDKMSNIMQSAFDKITDVTIGAFNFMSGALVALANDMKGHFLQFLDEYGTYIVAAAAGGGALALGAGGALGRGAVKGTFSMARLAAANPIAAGLAAAAGVTAYGLSQLAPTDQERLTKYLPEQRKQIQDSLARKGFGELNKYERKTAEEKLKELDEEEKLLIAKAKEAEKAKEARRTDNFSRFVETNSLGKEIGKVEEARTAREARTESAKTDSRRYDANSSSNTSPSKIDPLKTTFADLTTEQQDAFLLEQRKQEGFKKGNLSYDLNNPGAMLYAPWMKKYGGELDTTGRGVGDLKGKFARFPTLQDGINAQKALFLSPAYANLPLDKALNKWVTGDPNSNYDKGMKRANTDYKKSIYAAIGDTDSSSSSIIASTNTPSSGEKIMAATSDAASAAAVKPLFSPEDLAAFAAALRAPTMQGAGGGQVLSVEKATPYERDFYQGVVRAVAL